MLGNTYLHLFRGPVRNLEVKQSWIESATFSIVLQADLQSDIFFFTTAFTWSFQLLKIIQRNGGEHPLPYWKVVLFRYARLTPLYVFMILFLWKFIPTLGSNGPRFYQFEEEHGCGESWWWHLMYLNNIIPLR